MIKSYEPRKYCYIISYYTLDNIIIINNINIYCMKPYKIKGLKCAVYSIKCASVLYEAHNSAIIAIRVLYYPQKSAIFS